MKRSWCVDTGKTSYETKKKALGAASTSGKKLGVQLNVYKCPYCKSFHLTKNKFDREVSGGCKNY